jgi:fucose permease
VSVHTLVRGSLLLGLFGAGLVWWNPTEAVSLFGVAVVGFAIAPVFPGLVSGTSDRVSPEHAANTIGMQVSAAGLGGAVLPGFVGWLAERLSLEVVPVYLTMWFAVLLGLYSLAVWLGRRRAPSSAQVLQD